MIIAKKRKSIQKENTRSTKDQVQKRYKYQTATNRGTNNEQSQTK